MTGAVPRENPSYQGRILWKSQILVYSTGAVTRRGARCYDGFFGSIYIYTLAATIKTTDKEFPKVTYESVRNNRVEQQDSAYFYTLYDRCLWTQREDGDPFESSQIML